MNGDQKPAASDTVLAAIERKIEALHLEMAGLKAAIDNVPADIGSAVPDISPTLKALVVVVTGAKTAVETMAAHPALKQKPADYAADLDRRREAVAAEASKDIKAAKDDLQAQLQTVSGIVGAARTRDQQKSMLFLVGVSAACAGLVLSPVIAATTSWGPRFATWAMGESEAWKAGNRLFAHANPEFAERSAQAWNLSQYKGNPAALEACRAAAQKAQKDVPCSIVVRVPAE